MLAFKLDKNLRAIAGEGSLQEIVFRLIQVANAEGWVEDLVRGAYESNSKNSLLTVIAEELLTNYLEPHKVTLQNSHPKQSTQPQKILIFGSVLVVIILGAATVELLARKQPNETPDFPHPEKSQNETQAKYAQLEYFLMAKNWKEADTQTSQLMLNIANREKEGYLDYDSINTFSCPNLKRIDQLWVSNSNKRFGFSVQKEIWIKTRNQLGIKPEKWNDKDFENYERFARAVGWYDDKVRVNETGASGGFLSYDELLSRIKTNPFKSPRGSLPKNLAFDYKVSNQGVLFAHCDL